MSHPKKPEQARPPRGGLIPAGPERDGCGIGFVVDVKGKRSHGIVRMGLEMLFHLEHRGACGCDPLTGDGGGILIQIPDAFFRKAGPKNLPGPGDYAVGMVYLPAYPSDAEACAGIFEKVVREEGQEFLGWRDVPVDPEKCGELAREVMPVIRQVFIGRGRTGAAGDADAFERKLYVIRKRVEHQVASAGLKYGSDFYVCSLSDRTIVFKGQLISRQIPEFFLDLQDSSVESGLAMVHQRFSTNTFPAWKRAHPYRTIIHNGEINTLRGNINWMHAREMMFRSSLFGSDMEKILPVIDPDGSDSSMFDNALELLTHTGRSLPHAVMMMIPEAWQKDKLMDPKKRAFYRYHSCLMEPWDGPASIGFTDGRVIGAVLDRNGLRPSRTIVTKDGLVIMSSEVGVIDVDPKNVLSKGRLQPGKMFLVDTAKGRIVADEEIKMEIASRRPYAEWLNANLTPLDSLPKSGSLPGPLGDEELTRLQKLYGYTLEDLRILLAPMSLNGQEPVGSMGIDTPLAVLSGKPQVLFNYFKQLFAQVTNPPVDSLREDMVMSVETTLGSERNLFDETPEHCRLIHLESPTLSDDQLGRLRECAANGIRSKTVSTLFTAAEGERGMKAAIERCRSEASRAVDDGFQILILSDRGAGPASAAVPSLLAVSAVHHHLIRNGKRTRAGIVVESGEPREVMHFALLMGYGAGAWNPYLAYESIRKMIRDGILKGVDEETALEHYRKAVDKGVLKVATKMGISTLQSYRGAQIFEAVGLKKEFVDDYFTWTASRIGGVGLDVIAEETLLRHKNAWPAGAGTDQDLDPGGRYQWRRRGEVHMLDPDVISKLQAAVRGANPGSYQEFAKMINDQSRRLLTLRGLLKFKPSQPVPLDEVEPAKEIVKRFATGAMSLGSISREAHETMAIAMNRIGAKSNTGEGGEDPSRYVPDPNGDSRRSSIKQVASARFGVTIEYLVNADDLQIKIAQGAKPGEGGQLPGHKVDPYIAKIRYSVPGVGLISPPPHHDIYSIEDIAQLIHDLKNANPGARIHVKLVSEVGVGTVAAGVAKAKSDVVLISGYEGGTGASPLSSIQHAGLPWELGLAETQQVLVSNGLRGRIAVQVDGKLQTGRDVAVAALLGAEEFGFSTAPLIALGCIMMRVCHLNTCPVGIATQDPDLRKKFDGKPEHVINYFFYIAEELRGIMASLGFRTMNEMIGRTDRLDVREAADHWKARGLDLSPILHMPEPRNRWYALRCVEKQDHGLEKALDHQLIAKAMGAIESKRPITIQSAIKNYNRCVGTMLSSEIARRYGNAGLPEDTVRCVFQGSAGQSFGAFLARGVTLRLEGDSNDYIGKGLSGGKIIVVPPRESTFKAEENILIGNVALYGATDGEAYFRGMAGERFAVRNSGATAVVEGVGDHGCEYMTRGTVAVIGRTGRNFAAGMSGGVAYVWDADRTFQTRCNPGMVELQRTLEPKDDRDLKGLLEKHFEHTGSSVAESILDRWESAKGSFVKVLPLEYKKILESQHLDQEAMKLAAV
ncbi:MAG: glutamate synthase subunit alpha [Elusimicrobia bacterium RIFCSPHIGHO2_01_FULL_64_10]|nr:MAG: glutamate synthase subunit alpha [Elusimicrobia bacterium RIFCSPHIGHO2_01_FULL_64_10]